MKHGLAIAFEAAGAIGHQALALRRADRRAQIGLARQATFALAAFRRVERDDVIALLERGDAGAHVHHDARALVAQHAGKQPLRVGARQGEIIGVANAGRLDFNENFAGLRPVEVDLDDFQRLFGGECDGGAGFHPNAPI